MGIFHRLFVSQKFTLERSLFLVNKITRQALGMSINEDEVSCIILTQVLTY